MGLGGGSICAEAEWIAKKSKKWTGGHAEQTRQSLRDYVSPKIGRRPIGSLGAQEILGVLAPLEQGGKLETLRRVRQCAGAVLAYAAQAGRRADNPLPYHWCNRKMSARVT